MLKNNQPPQRRRGLVVPLSSIMNYVTNHWATNEKHLSQSGMVTTLNIQLILNFAEKRAAASAVRPIQYVCFKICVFYI